MTLALQAVQAPVVSQAPKGPKLAASGPALWLEVVSNVEALAALEPQWQELADGALEPNAFYEPWMALPALRTLEVKPGDGGVQFLLADLHGLLAGRSGGGAASHRRRPAGGRSGGHRVLAVRVPVRLPSSKGTRAITAMFLSRHAGNSSSSGFWSKML